VFHRRHVSRLNTITSQSNAQTQEQSKKINDYRVTSRMEHRRRVSERVRVLCCLDVLSASARRSSVLCRMSIGRLVSDVVYRRCRVRRRRRDNETSEGESDCLIDVRSVRDMNKMLADSDADRTYFVAELAKQEVLISDLTGSSATMNSAAIVHRAFTLDRHDLERAEFVARLNFLSVRKRL
jgi:hypothetical protein